MINENTRILKTFLSSIATDEYLYLLSLAPITQREKLVITSLYRDGLAVKEVCENLNTSDNNIQRIRKSTLKKIKKFLAKTQNPYLNKLKSDYLL